ncbi:MAG: hypothetical protein ABIV26_06210 [Candidatus Limnocylindrales bacterium]
MTAISAVTPPSLAARLLGLGSVFGKAFRDSRRTALLIGLLFAAIIAATASQIAIQFDSVQARLLFTTQLTALPAIFQGMLGEVIGIEKLGGFVSWRIFNIMPVMMGIWSIVALSGTLANELARGSLDVLAATPLVRRRLAVQKLLGYLAALVLALALLAIGTYASITAFAKLPGDEVSMAAALGHVAWLGLMTLVPGAAAFVAAPFIGRGGALGVGAVVLFASYVVASYADTVPAFDAIRGLSYFEIGAGPRPLAGRWDWPAMAALAVIAVGLLVAGIEAFVRRDLLVPSGGRFRIPGLRVWVMGPFTRGLGERLPAALAWGAILGLYGIAIAASADQFVAQISKIPQILLMVKQIYPDADLISAAGLLQLAFFQQGIIVLGLAAAAFVGGWASDEGERRLEVILATPVSRLAWGLRSGFAVLAAVIITTLVMMLGIAAGLSIAGTDPVRPTLGAAVLGLYAMALAGVGVAVGGVVRPSLAAPVTLILGLGFFILDLLGAILKLPTAILDLSLTRHLGQPMAGNVDRFGLAVCAALAIGGVVVGALGLRRRDVGR